ncbi:10199_t:CDS:2, partial [Gigaspora margarita]
NPTLLANPKIEFLDALGLFDPSEIAETILSPEAEREYLEALEILEPIPQFHQTDIISSGCELLDDHYQVEIGKKNELIWDIENRIETYIVEDSDWYYLESEKVNIEMPIFVLLTATFYLSLPKGIPKQNNGIINIKNEDNRCFEQCILEDLYLAPYYRERPQNQNPHLGELNFKGIQFLVKADNDTMEKFEKQNLSILVSIYGWSEKELILIRIASKSKVYNRCNHKKGNCQPHKLIRLLLITKDDPETGEPSQHYCLIQGREGLEKLAGYTTKHNSRLYMCDYCASHQTHNPKIDAQHIKDCEEINTLVQRTVMLLVGKNIYKFR